MKRFASKGRTGQGRAEEEKKPGKEVMEDKERKEPSAGKRIRVYNLSARQLLELDTCTRCSECVQWCPVYAQDEKEEITPRAKAKAFGKILRAQDGILAARDYDTLDPAGPHLHATRRRGISLRRLQRSREMSQRRRVRIRLATMQLVMGT